jgi:hypothetical protein
MCCLLFEKTKNATSITPFEIEVQCSALDFFLLIATKSRHSAFKQGLPSHTFGPFRLLRRTLKGAHRKIVFASLLWHVLKSRFLAGNPSRFGFLRSTTKGQKRNAKVTVCVSHMDLPK